MEIYPCFVLGCTSRANGYCNCIDEAVFMCKNHYFDHSTKKSDKGHNWFDIDAYQKKWILSENISQFLRNLYYTKYQAIKEATDLSNLILNSLDNLLRDIENAIEDTQKFINFLWVEINSENLTELLGKISDENFSKYMEEWKINQPVGNPMLNFKICDHFKTYVYSPKLSTSKLGKFLMSIADNKYDPYQFDVYTEVITPSYSEINNISNGQYPCINYSDPAMSQNYLNGTENQHVENLNDWSYMNENFTSETFERTVDFSCRDSSISRNPTTIPLIYNQTIPAKDLYPLESRNKIRMDQKQYSEPRSKSKVKNNRKQRTKIEIDIGICPSCQSKKLMFMNNCGCRLCNHCTYNNIINKWCGKCGMKYNMTAELLLDDLEASNKFSKFTKCEEHGTSRQTISAVSKLIKGLCGFCDSCRSSHLAKCMECKNKVHSLLKGKNPIITFYKI